MPGTLEACEDFFGTKDLYKILEIEKKASVGESKQNSNNKQFVKILTKILL